jgi:hypothetical protein
MRNPAGHGCDLDEFPNAKAWRARIAERPAVVEALEEGDEMRTTNVLTAGGAEAEKARSILFGQTHRK